MPLVLKDRVKETTTTTGTGTITLAGAVSGYQSFSVIGNANTTYYTIVDPAANAWEVGLGTYTAAGTTLSRDTVLESSNSGSLVNFGAGTKDVFVTYPAERAVVSGTTAYLSLPAPSTNGNVLTSNGTEWTSATPASTSTLTITNLTGAYTVLTTDAGKVFNCTSGTFTVSLTAAATLGSGFNCWIWNTGTGVITIDPNAAETIDGVATLTLQAGEGMQVVCTGTNWQTGDKKVMRAYAEQTSAASGRPSATGSNSVAIGSTSQATSTYAFAAGLNSGAGGAVAAGSGATSLGGSYASGTDSFAAAVTNNTNTYGARGANSVAISRNANASAIDSISIGNTSSASSNYGISIGTQSIGGVVGVGIGYQAKAIGYSSVAIGQQCQVTSLSSSGTAIGTQAVSGVIGKYVYASGALTNAGDAQKGLYVLRSYTTTATPKAITTDNSTATTNNQVSIGDNAAYAFSGLIVAKRNGSTESAGWRIEGLLMRSSGAASTTLVNSAITVLNNAPGWSIALSADTTNGGMAITVTGAAAANIAWVATIDTAEAAY